MKACCFGNRLFYWLFSFYPGYLVFLAPYHSYNICPMAYNYENGENAQGDEKGRGKSVDFCNDPVDEALPFVYNICVLLKGVSLWKKRKDIRCLICFGEYLSFL